VNSFKMETPRKKVSMSKDNGDASSSKKNSGSIQVVLRLRPMNEQEKKFGTLPVVTASTNNKTVTVIKDKNARKARLTYSFDNVYTAFSTQEEVFQQTLLPVFDDVLEGYESTVFAYGQTGTGKTHTMEGDLSDPDMHGVIPRSAMTIFERLQSDKYSEYKVMCSYLEIYNEELSDLLQDDNLTTTDNSSSTPTKKRPNTNKLEIIQGKAGPFCRGLSEKEVTSSEDVLALMAMAQEHRQIGETKMNKSSSRSHCIFTMKIKAKSVTSDGAGIMEINGKLHMVDLAGSECAKTASGDGFSEPTRERERMNINRSLLTLGRVISMLKEQSISGGKKSVRIPYRDSKLTRILQESLGGRCKTVIIATLSPSVTAIEESISTLNYAQSANRIVNRPVATSYLSINKLATATPTKNSAEDGQGYNTIEDWNEMEIRLQYMQTQVEEAQSALARKHLLQQEAEEKAEKATAEKEEMEAIVQEQREEIDSLRDTLNAETLKNEETTRQLVDTQNKLTEQTSRAEKAEETCRNLEDELQTAKQKIEKLVEDLEREIGLRKDALEKLRNTSIELKKTKALLKATQTTESVLTDEALALIEILKESITDGDGLYQLLEKHREIDIDIRSKSCEYSDTQNKILDDILQLLLLLTKNATDLCKKLSVDAAENHDQGNHSINETSNLFQQISSDISEISSTLRNQAVGPGGIVPTVASTTSDAMAGLDHSSKIILENEDALVTAISFLRERLSEHSSALEKYWTIHDANAESAITSLESSVESSKGKIKQMVDAAVETLTVVRSSQKETRRLQSELVTTWEKSSLELSQNINTTANHRLNTITESLSAFKRDIKHVDHIDKILSSQGDYISKFGDKHKSELHKQHSELEELKKIQEMDRQKIDSLRESFMSNVMKNIQSIMDEQMEIIKTENIRHFDVCDKRNEKLMKQNNILTDSAKTIFSDLQKDNSNLTEESKSARKNDEFAAEEIEGARKTLDDLHDASKKHQVMTESYARKAEENISKLSKVDTDADDIAGKLNGDGEDYTDHLENSILNKGKENLNLLAGSGRDLAHYGHTVLIPECLASLDGMEESRPNMIQNFNAATKKNKERLKLGKADVESISENQCVKIDEVRIYARSKEDYYANDICKVQKGQLDSQRDKLVSQTKEYESTTMKNVSNCSSGASTLKDNMEDLMVETIKAREEVTPLVERTTFDFSENLSSTTEESIIYSQLNFETELAIGVES
jgi:hypothetical protein